VEAVDYESNKSEHYYVADDIIPSAPRFHCALRGLSPEISVFVPLPHGSSIFYPQRIA